MAKWVDMLWLPHSITTLRFTIGAVPVWLGLKGQLDAHASFSLSSQLVATAGVTYAYNLERMGTFRNHALAFSGSQNGDLNVRPLQVSEKGAATTHVTLIPIVIAELYSIVTTTATFQSRLSANVGLNRAADRSACATTQSASSAAVFAEATMKLHLSQIGFETTVLGYEFGVKVNKPYLPVTSPEWTLVKHTKVWGKCLWRGPPPPAPPSSPSPPVPMFSGFADVQAGVTCTDSSPLSAGRVSSSA